MLSSNYELYLVIMSYWPYGLPYVPVTLFFLTKKQCVLSNKYSLFWQLLAIAVIAILCQNKDS